MYDEPNFVDKKILRTLNKIVKQPKNLFGDRVLKITAKRGIKITAQYKLAALWIDVKLLPERKSYYTYEEVVSCYRYYLNEAVGYFIKYAKQLMENGTYDKRNFLNQVMENDNFTTHKELAKSLKQYLYNRYRSRKHRDQVEAIFKAASLAMSIGYGELIKNY